MRNNSNNINNSFLSISTPERELKLHIFKRNNKSFVKCLLSDRDFIMKDFQSGVDEIKPTPYRKKAKQYIKIIQNQKEFLIDPETGETVLVDEEIDSKINMFSMLSENIIYFSALKSKGNEYLYKKNKKLQRIRENMISDVTHRLYLNTNKNQEMHRTMQWREKVGKKQRKGNQKI